VTCTLDGLSSCGLQAMRFADAEHAACGVPWGKVGP